LTEMYNAKVMDEETIAGRKSWVLELNAKVNDATYAKPGLIRNVTYR
jgi:hypothetical protein